MTALNPVRSFRRHGDAPDSAAIYRAIRNIQTPNALADPFAAHVFACALTIAICEAAEVSDNVSVAIGLDRAALSRVIDAWAPAAGRHIDLNAQPERVKIDEEEAQLRDLLRCFRCDDSQMTDWMISIVTRRAMAPRHLWQDLGLLNRDELTRLIARWFPELTARNVGNMKWKKFFYRSVCELEGFTLCAAPTCRECGDFDDCFGDERGESVLARLSRNDEM